MAIRDVRVVSVPVSDQDTSLAFYVDRLGFELRADQPMGNQGRWVEVAPRGGTTSLTLVTWFATMEAGTLKGIVLECDDIEATVTELAARGVAFSGDIERAPWGTFVEFDDPDGNGFVLMEGTGGEGGA